MKKEITVYDFTKPQSLVNMGTTVKDFIVKQNLYQNIKGKNYVLVEGWQFAGGLVGVAPIVREVKRVKEGVKPDEVKYEAYVELIHHATGNIVGSGWATCSNKERGKGAFEDYAVASMAQTRATGKAFRLLLGWIMKSVGYEATPAEDMDTVVEEEKKQVNLDFLKNLAKSLTNSPLETKQKFFETYEKELSESEKEEIKTILQYEVSS